MDQPIAASFLRFPRFILFIPPWRDCVYLRPSAVKAFFGFSISRQFVESVSQFVFRSWKAQTSDWQNIRNPHVFLSANVSSISSTISGTHSEAGKSPRLAGPSSAENNAGQRLTVLIGDTGSETSFIGSRQNPVIHLPISHQPPRTFSLSQKLIHIRPAEFPRQNLVTPFEFDSKLVIDERERLH